MDLQKFGIKLYLNTNDNFKSKDFIPVFHNWIQEKVVSEHLLIDVADYSHIKDGPGVMLIAHEGHFCLDQEEHKAGIMYMRRSHFRGNFTERFINVFSIVIQAAKRLTDNNINKKIDFSRDLFRFISNDRRVVENTSINQSVYQDEVQKALKDMYPNSKWEYKDISNENERMAFTVYSNTDINIFNKN